MNKLVSSLLAASFCFSAAHACVEKESEGRVKFDPLGKMETSALPKQVLMQVELIQLDQREMTKLLFDDKLSKSDGLLRKKLQTMLDSKKATMLDSSLLIARPGESARSNSTSAVVYPTEYLQPDSEANRDEKEEDNTIKPKDLKKEAAKNPGKSKVPDKFVAPLATSFEERPVGFIFEINPTLGAGRDSSTISVDFEMEKVYFTGYDSYGKWKSGESEVNVVMPKFYKMQMKTGFTLHDGKYCLAGSLTPKDSNGNPDESKKVLVFVRGVVKFVR